MLQKIFVLTRDAVIGAWTTVPTKEIHGVLPQNVIRMIRSRRLRWQEQVACLREKCIQNFGGET